MQIQVQVVIEGTLAGKVASSGIVYQVWSVLIFCAFSVHEATNTHSGDACHRCKPFSMDPGSIFYYTNLFWILYPL